MKHTLLIGGLISIVLAAVLYALGFTSYNYMVGDVQVLIFPSAFLFLLGFALLFSALKNTLKSGEI